MSSSWIIPLAVRADGLQLFCLPCAGGSAAMFRTWAASASKDLALYAIELPGRGRRLPESPIGSMAEIVEHVVTAIAPMLREPFGFYGHSMGGLMAFELALACQERLGRPPAQIIVAGTVPPTDQPRGGRTAEKDDAGLIRRLRRIGGTPPEILNHAELMSLLLPAIRADMALVETYARAPEHVVACAVDALSGREDAHCTTERLSDWRTRTTGPFRQHELAGGHFFVTEQETALLAIINNIARTVARSRRADPAVA